MSLMGILENGSTVGLEVLPSSLSSFELKNLTFNEERISTASIVGSALVMKREQVKRCIKLVVNLSSSVVAKIIHNAVTIDGYKYIDRPVVTVGSSYAPSITQIRCFVRDVQLPISRGFQRVGKSVGKEVCRSAGLQPSPP
ncbi:hypothetical protein K0M31_012390 [Melipona bicolor]|uniref:Uncharacterized protein n=1 Tax=Melipona bicolor TaxID=60889 RepID=A0AA40FJT4_9HYME|nr:hypothetical protein K0M31_012390 [Melipona bicolor]